MRFSALPKATLAAIMLSATVVEASINYGPLLPTAVAKNITESLKDENFVEGLGLVNGTLEVVRFKKEYRPGTQGGHGTFFEFATELGPNPGKHPNGCGGQMPRIYVFDKTGKRIAFRGVQNKAMAAAAAFLTGGVVNINPRTELLPGRVSSVLVQHYERPAYALFSALHDDVCYSWIAADWDWAEKQRVISGDFGYLCGGDWYYSTILAHESSEYSPRCFFTGAKKNRAHKGVQVRLDAFATENLGNLTDPRSVCNGVDFAWHDEQDPKELNLKRNNATITADRTANTNERPKRANATTVSETKKPSKHTVRGPGNLVISDFTSHSAKELCESETSSGPDFVSLEEGLFCDMTNRVLSDVCTEKSTGPCFDLASRSMAGMRLVSRSQGHKKYKRVIQWHMDSPGKQYEMDA